jgi:2-polyprenyl-6-methoxyphenol hydroxylase-like FAD-dependent oxidoreductase
MTLQTVLARNVEENSLRLGTECTGYTQDADSITVRLGDGRDEHADVLIGADGINSIVRSQHLGGWSKPRYAGYALWFGITNLQTDSTNRSIFTESDGRGARFIFFPVGGEQVYWSAIANAEEGDVGEGSLEERSGDKRQLIERCGTWAQPTGALIESTDESAIYRREIADRKPMKSWGEGRWTLLGDAAHAITPNLGQGAAQAIEDAVVLADSLHEAMDAAAALRRYESRRMARTASFTRRARMIGAMGRWHNPIACGARDQLARILIPGPALRQHMKDMAAEF